MATGTVLGISPGTRALGLSVIRQGELVDWRVRSFNGAWSQQKHDRILSAITRFQKEYSADVVAIKQIDLLRSSPELRSLAMSIARQAKRRSCKVVIRSLDDLDYERRTAKRKSLTKEVARKYPEMYEEYRREQANRTEYYTRMFEAVAIADYGDDEPS
ncbi:hypothetical protein [Nemorincola caseinilytica]|uniref:hypothetical protein n=1 Tax=Nemorincola caseinilytica TaxID=2054315 RepID=UPI0031EF1415